MRTRKKVRRKKGRLSLKKARNSLQARLDRVGAEHFGILAVDSSKARFQVLLGNFCGTVLMEPLEVDNSGPALDRLVETVRLEMERHGLKDLVAAIERTGRFHHPIRTVLRRHWTVKMVHPFATKQLREPADPGNKTDATDLVAILRAILMGYGTDEQELSESGAAWRLVSREREALVRHRARARVRIQDRVEALLPGYAALFTDLWKMPAALVLAQDYASAAALREAGPDALIGHLRQAGLSMRRDTLGRILAWAATAAPADPSAPVLQRLLADERRLHAALESQIQAYERDLARFLADAPFVLLLSIQGIGVVSAAGYGAELGPIEHYPDAHKITGRAGLYPSRYQSDETDRADGPLVPHRNARLRDALMEIAHNLVRCNPYFKAWASLRRSRGWAEKKLRVAAACTFSRISYSMLAGRQLFDHPAVRGRDAILPKLTEFILDHGVPPDAARDLLRRAAQQIPPEARPAEAEALRPELTRRRQRHSIWTRGTGPQLLGEILPELLAWLGLPVAPEPERNAFTPTQEKPTRTPH